MQKDKLASILRKFLTPNVFLNTVLKDDLRPRDPAQATVHAPSPDFDHSGTKTNYRTEDCGLHAT